MITYRPRVGFTGSRELHAMHQPLISRLVIYLDSQGIQICVGDAKGLDAMVWTAIGRYTPAISPHMRFDVDGAKTSVNLVARSKLMVHEVVQSRRLRSGIIGVVDCPCPNNVFPKDTFYGNGSGTWGTLAYASFFNLPIMIINTLPDSYTYEDVFPRWFEPMRFMYLEQYNVRCYTNHVPVFDWYGITPLYDESQENASWEKLETY